METPAYVRYLFGLLSKARFQNNTSATKTIPYGSFRNVDYREGIEGLGIDYDTDQIIRSTSTLVSVTSFEMTTSLPTKIFKQSTSYSYNISERTDYLSTKAPFKPESYHHRLKEIIDGLTADCLHEHHRQPPLNTVELYCYRTVDNFGGCWPDTSAGQRAQIPCPKLPSFNVHAFAYRDCTDDGTWFVHPNTSQRWANYSECRQKEIPEVEHIYIFVGGFVVSLVMLIASLIIFFRFRQLRCDRITIHKNLFISYVFTGIAWTLYYCLAAMNGDVISTNPIWCQVLHVLCQYFIVCNFMWMFCEGLYLNIIMIYAFNSGKALLITCYILGWGLPVLLTVVYAVVRGSNSSMTTDCWIGDSALIWIVYGPIVVSIGVNVLFLINIVRLLITKLRQMPEADQSRKATRATLILVPLLGLQYLLIPIRPEEGTNLHEAYHIAVALFTSLQGAFVSMMYCFCNSEVIQVLRRRWNQHKLMYRSSARASNTHANTYTTTEPVTQANATYFSTSDNKEPPLEMSKIGS
ncbi:calcitonin gene-related peptide type 1 receptor-like [Dreissena polymorpha]|uniref:Calcitonin receptor n=1 Tax=Dreissena polymorpha TaxID=45954 RepID=A0A9D4GM04_DREPO|nr:calcitonin gene-related peptide type 1 receptor-like [Dreissena polymorpha]KAH3817993.1 hypothetical protein DPMN_119578 [Dreissena polymorpha]